MLHATKTRTWVRLSTAILCAAGLTTACGDNAGPVGQTTQSSVAAASSTTSAAPVPPPPAPLSDEGQIRQTVRAFQDAANTQNWEAYLDVMCPAMRAQFTGPVMDAVKKNRANTGLTTAEVLNVTFDGDKATAMLDSTNEIMGNMKVSIPLARGDDGWAICKVA